MMHCARKPNIEGFWWFDGAVHIREGVRTGVYHRTVIVFCEESCDTLYFMGDDVPYTLGQFEGWFYGPLDFDEIKNRPWTGGG